MNPVNYIRLLFCSLLYNVHFSWSYAVDTAMEPLFWLIDRFTGFLGPILVVTVFLLKISVIAIAYGVGLPYYWNKNPWLATFLVIFGQYFFVNVAFYYWKALTTSPGIPPTNIVLNEVATICKKCIYPKPPRTHHCSVCKKCILKMDHHCPWLNNCVGHWNHRYFFLYMAHTVLGCVFIMLFGFEILWVEVFTQWDSQQSWNLRELGIFSRRSMVLFEALMTTGCFLFLGGLTLWHARLITRGETSIEAHINATERKRFKEVGKVYRNPYDFGPWGNWCLFLGLTEDKGWSSVLLPSGHSPKGNGLEWDTIYSCDIKWNSPYIFNGMKTE